MNVSIRIETPADVQAIEAVTIAAFSSAPHADHTEQYVINALRRAGQLSISLVADLEGTVIGHVAISPISISDGTSAWFGLGPVSVLPQHQRRGTGSQLIHESLRLLRARGASGCVVLGDPKYYARFGFLPNPNLILPGVPPEYFQSLSFNSSSPHGTVSYHKAFEAQS